MPPSERMPKSTPKYVLQFDRGRFSLRASTEDPRLTWPVRIAALLGGLIFAVIGFGLMALVVPGILRGGFDAVVTLLFGIPVLAVMAGYGCDLMARGLLGRPWSRRYWQAFGSWLDRRFKLRHGVILVLVLFGLPILGDVVRQGIGGLAALMIPLGILAQVILHEAGHLTLAGAAGYRPRQLIAGPLMVHLDGPRARLAFNRSLMACFGGLASYDPVRRTRQKDFWVVAAGPLANFAGSWLALETLGWPYDSSFVSTFLRTFIGSGIAMGLFNLLPLPRVPGSIALDGRELLDLVRDRR